MILSLLALAALLAWPGAVRAQDGQSGQSMTDGQVAGLVKAADDAQIDAAKLALSKSQSDAVKSFAQEMIADHARVNDDLRPFVTPADQIQGAAQKLTDRSKEQSSALTDMTGAAFDSQYAADEVQDHRDLLGVLDQAAAGGSRNPAFQRVLERARAMVAAHLTQAEQLETQLRGH